jgi:polyribonucleotide nucleotidyltransferase
LTVPVRPLFPDGYRFETQIVGSVLSADDENDPDVIALTGASCALYLSDIPFDNPIAGVRIGLIDGKYLINPDLRRTARIGFESRCRRNRRSNRDGRSGSQ